MPPNLPLTSIYGSFHNGCKRQMPLQDPAANIGAPIGPQTSLFPHGLTHAVPSSTPFSYHHALALIRFYCQRNLAVTSLAYTRASVKSIYYSMKSTLLAAAGRLNFNLESTKQGHHKKSGPLYSRDDAWPSFFSPT